jgi:hypothetical protein
MWFSSVESTSEPKETPVSKDLRKESHAAPASSKPQKDVSIRLKRMSGTGRFEAEITIEGGKVYGGRAVVLTSPRSLAFPKKG